MLLPACAEVSHFAGPTPAQEEAPSATGYSGDGAGSNYTVNTESRSYWRPEGELEPGCNDWGIDLVSLQEPCIEAGCAARDPLPAVLT